MPKSRRKRRRITTVPEINLTPLIDTALTLLVIFMVTAPMINNAIKISLPTGNAQEDKGVQHALVVAIDQHEKIFLNNSLVADKDQLMSILKEQVSLKSDRSVLVRADKVVPSGFLLELVDDIKMLGGISYVALATTKRT